jgi:hypothetical protein
MASSINSLEWWDSYFEAQWEQNHGREQTRHFWTSRAPRSIKHEPPTRDTDSFGRRTDRSTRTMPCSSRRAVWRTSPTRSQWRPVMCSTRDICISCWSLSKNRDRCSVARSAVHGRLFSGSDRAVPQALADGVSAAAAFLGRAAVHRVLWEVGLRVVSTGLEAGPRRRDIKWSLGSLIFAFYERPLL